MLAPTPARAASPTRAARATSAVASPASPAVPVGSLAEKRPAAARAGATCTVAAGYLGLTFLTQGFGDITPLEAVGLYNQPGGSLMWVSFWAVAAGFGMGKYAGQVTGPLRPPERITADEIRWDTNDPQEVAKMKQWVKVGGYSLILWWAIIGGLIMTYLYSVAGYAYLHDQYLQTGRIPTGVEVPIQMATIAGGVLGPMAGWLMTTGGAADWSAA